MREEIVDVRKDKKLVDIAMTVWERAFVAEGFPPDKTAATSAIKDMTAHFFSANGKRYGKQYKGSTGEPVFVTCLLAKSQTGGSGVVASGVSRLGDSERRHRGDDKMSRTRKFESWNWDHGMIISFRNAIQEFVQGDVDIILDDFQKEYEAEEKTSEHGY